MLEKINYEPNYNLESNVIDLTKAKKLIKNKKKNNKKSAKTNQLNRRKIPDGLRSSIYKRILFLTVILIFAVGANFVWFKVQISENIFLSRFGTKCTGKVIETVEDISLLERGDRIVYKSTIEFKTINGKNMEFKTNAYRDFNKYNKDAIAVVYNIDNPKMAKVDSFDEIIMPMIVFTLSGIAFVIFPIYLIYFQCLKKLKNLNERMFI